MNRYILLPPHGLRATLSSGASPELCEVFRALSRIGKRLPSNTFRVWKAKTAPAIRVLAEFCEHGAKLVEMTVADKALVRMRHPGMRILPEFNYQLAALGLQGGNPVPLTPEHPNEQTMQLAIVSATNGVPISGVEITALGFRATTNVNGRAILPTTGDNILPRIAVAPPPQFISKMLLNVALPGPGQISLDPVSANSGTDVLRSTYGVSTANAGAGVRVAVIDSGVAGDHPDLVVSGGRNTVDGEEATDYGPAGVGHGTHVAGIIAGRSSTANGMRGLSPAVELYSYRVTPRTTSRDPFKPTSWSVIHAIEAAIQDRCDILNLSLAVDNADGGQLIDESVQSAISRARAAGSILVCAAGNGERSRVMFPASDSRALAVSAFGSHRLCEGRAEGLYETEDRASDPDLFIPSFCCTGEEMDLTAPGVGIYSTLPGNTYGIMSGTSMAAPAATGRLAVLLSGRPDLLALPRDQARSDALMALALQSSRGQGFGRDFEGNGIL